MVSHLKIFLFVSLILLSSRIIPHPPNFTSLIALSFYIPIIFGANFITVVLTCFILSDFIIGFHSTLFFTWGSVVLIGLIAKSFNKGITKRLFGVLSSCCIFFIISNFGVWSLGTYDYSLEGILLCYTLALPFFGNTIISTIIYSLLFETLYKLNKNFLFIKNSKNI